MFNTVCDCTAVIVQSRSHSLSTEAASASVLAVCGCRTKSSGLYLTRINRRVTRGITRGGHSKCEIVHVVRLASIILARCCQHYYSTSQVAGVLTLASHLPDPDQQVKSVEAFRTTGGGAASAVEP